ncbi:MAG: hypothetical protein NTX40_10675 [Planctomycetota bacterium]|nr:hypothetical protein [Planctomycetota bacterium]
MKRAIGVGLGLALLTLAAARGGLGQGTSGGDKKDNAEKIKALAEQVTAEPTAVSKDALADPTTALGAGKAPVAPPATADDAEAKRKAREEALRQAQETARTRRALGTPSGTFEFSATPLSQVLQMLAAAGGFAVVLDKALEEAGIDLSAHPVTMHLSGMRYEDAIYLLLPRECGYRVEAGYVLVTTLEKSWLPLKTVVYSVRDAVTVVPNFVGPRFEIGDITSQSQGGGGTNIFGNQPEEPEDATQATPERIVDMVKHHVRNANDRRIATWDDEGGPATVQYLEGKLIISQTYEGQRAVARLVAAIQ